MSSPPPSLPDYILRLGESIFEADQPGPSGLNLRKKQLKQVELETSDDDFDDDDSVKDPNCTTDKSIVIEKFLNSVENKCEMYYDQNCRSLPSNFSSDTEPATPVLTRKRKRQPEIWKQNVRKTLREAGEKYINIKNKEMSAKIVRPPCKSSYFFMCTRNFTESNRKEIHSTFWSLTDNDKNSFYSKFVKKAEIKRRRQKNSERKQNTFMYYLEGNGKLQQVCRTFFLNTLCIDIKRIYYFFKILHDEKTGIPLPRQKGKNSKRVTSADVLEGIRT